MPATMARKKKTTDEQQPERQPPKRSGKPIQAYISDEMHDALQAFIENSRPRPTMTSVVEMALEDLLRKVGAWPPSPRGKG
jgi:hypothetical protein